MKRHEDIRKVQQNKKIIRHIPGRIITRGIAQVGNELDPLFKNVNQKGRLPVKGLITITTAVTV